MPARSGPVAALLILAYASSAVADEPLHARIDRLIAAGHPNHSKLAAPAADDGEFLRRVTLDLSGTIPSTAEATAFFADTAPDKRVKLIDRLLAAPSYARRMAQAFDVILMERRKDTRVTRAAWETYLRDTFAANRPYDAFARELLSADGSDAKLRPAAKFFLDRDLEPNLITRDLGRVFLGRNMGCAQCHDHPTVNDYKQADYYGIQAFINRTFLFPNAQAPTAVIAEKADGEVNFTSVFDKAKKTSGTGPRMPGLKPLDEPKAEKGKEYAVAPAKDVRPVPAYSRRERLAAAVTSPDNPAFARTAVNRLWALLLGRGIIDPVDQDHADNPPSHPELLDTLARDFVAHNYDVKRLVREIVLSRTYQRSSEVPATLTDVPADRYLVGPLKPLAAEQLAYALSEATGNTSADAKAAPLVATFRGMYGGVAGEPDDGTTQTLSQTLFLKNGPVVRGLTQPKAGNLADRLGKLPPDRIADELFLSVLTRRPTADEKTDVTAALTRTPAAERPVFCGELVWALVTSAEFRFNH
ncbi:DUF1549 and DUF1553 domain-containing protein [Urbifossiella limnaea]|uniref:DUF1553 domain-containing protein n=1 Tax=Urbifossiella limnaea TaxID=2528023 RepID=A0A517XTU3_9BACT|nr:DUF1549 and DUF1553 domain-containing protein [Urbifossiella limnaea]QDU20923.1 hypothetical protein ETAA1_28860 [Urbifossiella limnaea]